ncbi:MAG TPA: DCC1-like thiol-disulfide oxidoreductase family protein [Terriglobales bacterium]|nr:DCC1-like thiol-disulfide oxidoreductase family protein [Terriglobales bacterium]
MISLTSEMTDGKGRHARGWLFFDGECDFCSRIAAWMEMPMRRRRLAVAPLQDPRVGALLGLSLEELLRAIRYVSSEGGQYSGADALLMLAREFWWLRPLIWIARVPGMRRMMFVAYEGIARRRNCQAQMHGALKGMADENHVC